MKILKCTKCGSSRLLLKHSIDDECGHKCFDTVIFWVVGIFTLGLYFIFKFCAEKKRTELGLDYFECEDCGFKIRASKIDFEEVKDEKKEEPLSEEEIAEIREIGKKPVDMATWKEERQKAVIKRREKAEGKEGEEENSVSDGEKDEKN